MVKKVYLRTSNRSAETGGEKPPKLLLKNGAFVASGGARLRETLKSHGLSCTRLNECYQMLR